MITTKTLTPDDLDAREDSGKTLDIWIGRKVLLNVGVTGVLVKMPAPPTETYKKTLEWLKDWWATKAEKFFARPKKRRGDPPTKPEEYLKNVDAPWFAVRWQWKCRTRACRNRVTVYAVSGCHFGAYCYIQDKNGKTLADLRNNQYTCKDHIPTTEEKIRSKVSINLSVRLTVEDKMTEYATSKQFSKEKNATREARWDALIEEGFIKARNEMEQKVSDAIHEAEKRDASEEDMKSLAANIEKEYLETM